MNLSCDHLGLFVRPFWPFSLPSSPRLSDLGEMSVRNFEVNEVNSLDEEAVARDGSS